MALRRLVFALAAASCFLVALPGAAAQSPSVGIHNPDTPTPTTLFLHLIDLQDIPINTQQPDDNWTQSQAWGLTTSTTSCLPKDTPGVDASQSWHTFYGYSSPSYVEYAIEQGGKPRIHNERGISYDALLDPNTPFVLHWYMTVQSVGSGSSSTVDPDQVPTPLANVVVQAAIRAGDAISVDDRAYNTGPLLVHGKTEPATLVADQVVPVPGQAPVTHVHALGKTTDGKWLYEFAVPMEIDTPVIPRATGYNLRVDVYMDDPACADPTGTGPNSGAIMPNTVRIHSDKQHRPRMEFAITDPIRIEALHPQFVGDELVVHAAMNAAWGNYDVGEPSTYTPQVKDGLRLSVTGPTDAKGLYLVNLVSKTNPHYMHQDAVTLVYDWPYKVDRAVPGVYTVHLEAQNDQGTATATADTTFEIGKSGNSALNCTLGTDCKNEGPALTSSHHASPGAGLPLSVLGLVAAASAGALRRRKD
jgi:hypothetical protein